MDARFNPAEFWFMWAWMQIASYSLTSWFLFLAITWCSARSGQWPGLMLGHVLIGVVVFGLDLMWIHAEMNKPGWRPQSGPDLDLVFLFGVVLRILLINTILLPLGIQAMDRSRAKRRHCDVESLLKTNSAACL